MVLFPSTAKVSAKTAGQHCHELQESGPTSFSASRKLSPSRPLRVAASPAHLHAPLVLALPVEHALALGHPDVLKSAVFEVQCFQAPPGYIPLTSLPSPCTSCTPEDFPLVNRYG